MLRESDGVAIGAHVYGGSTNTASVIGPHGNQYSDYISAADIKLESPGINLVVVGSSSAAPPTEPKNTPPVAVPATNGTGTDTNTKDAQPPQANGAEQGEEGLLGSIGWVLRNSDKVLGLTGALAGQVGRVLTTSTATTVFQLQHGAEILTKTAEQQARELEAAVQRALLADAVLIAVAQRKATGTEEGFFGGALDLLKNGLPAPFRHLVDAVSPVLAGPLGGIISATAVAARLDAKTSEEDFSNIFKPGRGGVLPVQDILRVVGRPESSVEGQDSSTEEGFLDVLKQIAGLSRSMPLVGNGGPFEGLFAQLGKVPSSEEGFWEGISSAIGTISKVPGWMKNNGTRAIIGPIVHMPGDHGRWKSESALDDGAEYSTAFEKEFWASIRRLLRKDAERYQQQVQESVVEVDEEALLAVIRQSYLASQQSASEAESTIEGVAEADRAQYMLQEIASLFVQRFIVADLLLTALMQQPVEKVKEEGFFDSIADGFRMGWNGVGEGIIKGVGAVARGPDGIRDLANETARAIRG